MRVAYGGAAMKREAGRVQGFSMVELIVVVSVIAILLGTAIPGIARYIRTYEIRAAASEITGQIQTARMRAVQKNVNLGVVWAADSVNASEHRSGWVVEDDQMPQSAPNWTAIGGEDWNFLLGNGAAGSDAQARRIGGGMRPIRREVQFVNPTQCGLAAGNRSALRFNRFGAVCALPDATCQANPPNMPAYPNVITLAGETATVCLEHRRRGLRKIITITRGGRVQAVDGWR